MSIFGRIKDAIFGGAAHAQPAPQAAPRAAAPAAAPHAQPAAAQHREPVDMTPILDGMVAKKGQTLDWRHSIVDLMKAIDLDSSLAARRELAGELGYDGDTDDTATMNMWLHKRVMARLSGEGVKTPA